MEHIILLIDMDCFYVQVEQRDRPETRGKPCVVAQYNGDKGGGIIAVSYEARAEGVKRGMWGRTARSKCADLILFEVAEKRGKADLEKYRSAGAEVIQCIAKFVSQVERASVDEAYVDLTDNVNELLGQPDKVCSLLADSAAESFVVAQPGCFGSVDDEAGDKMSYPLGNIPRWADVVEQSFTDGKRFAIASAITYTIRQEILSKTGFTCSAGIASNKTLAKLACSLNKPNKQTIVPPESGAFLIQNTPISKIRNLGGKLGAAVIERFGIETLGQLSQVDQSALVEEFGEKTAQWLHQLSRGYDCESITPRSLPQSIGCSKNFVGPSALTTNDQIEHWLRCLSEELFERLVKDQVENQRHPTRLTLAVRTGSHQAPDRGGTAKSNGFSRVLPNDVLYEIAKRHSVAQPPPLPTPPPCPTDSTVAKTITSAALAAMQDALTRDAAKGVWHPGITCLSLLAGKFVSMGSNDSADIRTLLMSSSSRIPPTNTAHESPEPMKPIAAHSSSSEMVRTKSEETNRHRTTSFFKRLRVAEVSTTPPETPVKSSTHDAPKKQPHPAFGTDADPEKETPLPIISCPTESSREQSLERDSPPANYFTSHEPATADWMVCAECGSRVSVWQMPEHSDFHMAQRVQSEWSKESAAPSGPASSRSRAAPPPPATRGRRGKRSKGVAAAAAAASASNTLDRFILRGNK